MKYLTYSGNTLVDVDLPDSATVFYPPPPLPGLRTDEVPAALEHAVEHPLGMDPLPDLVGKGSDGRAYLRAWDEFDRHSVILREADDVEVMELALIENLQRKDLTAFEEAEALQSLAKTSHYTHEDLARRL